MPIEQQEAQIAEAVFEGDAGRLALSDFYKIWVKPVEKRKFNP